MREIIKQYASKYDRSIVAILVCIGAIISIYIATGSKINSIVEGTPIVQSIKTDNQLQKQKLERLEKDVDLIRVDIKEIANFVRGKSR